VFADALHLQGDIHSQLQNPAVADGAGAMASLLLVAPVAETRLDGLRRILPKTAGASLIRPGVLFARILAGDSFELRKTLVPALRLLHGGELPRTWSL
jgi:urease accessory protein